MAFQAEGVNTGDGKLAMLDRVLEHVPHEKRLQVKHQILRQPNNLEGVSVAAMRALSRSLEEHLDVYLYLGNHDD